MRPVLFTAIATSALVASIAMAQTPPPPPDGGPPPPPPPNGMDGGRGPGGFMHDGFRHGHRPPMPPPLKAAVFRFRAGDRSVFVKCAEDEPTKACTDAVAAMMQSINPPAK